MAMNWVFENRQGVGVLELRGYLGDSALARFNGAMGWALARCTGPVVIDLTHLKGCSASGEAALEEAARHAVIDRRVLAICGSHGIGGRLTQNDGQAVILLYSDVDSAVAALSAGPPPLLRPAPVQELPGWDEHG